MSDDKIQLVLIDDDPVFQLGLSAAFQGYTDLEIVGRGEMASFQELLAPLGQDSSLVILLAFRGSFPEHLCQQIRQDYPQGKILLLFNQVNLDLQPRAKALGVKGYCLKGTGINDLVKAIRQVATGEEYWPESPTTINKSLPKPVRPPQWLYNMRQSGLQQIEDSLVEVKAFLQKPHLTLWDLWYWQGRHRELVVARWLVNQLLPVEVIVESSHSKEISPSPSSLVTRSNSLISSQQLLLKKASDNLTTSQLLFANTLEKIQSGVKNTTEQVLEIDILREDKKQELLYLVLQQVGKVLEELTFLKLDIKQLSQRREAILRQIWQSTTTEFFSKYYSPKSNQPDYRLVDFLLRDTEKFLRESKEKVPFVIDLFAYLTKDKPLVIDNIPYPPQAPESLSRAEIILQNLLIQVANGVMEILLNNYPEAETIKYNLYQKCFFSSREIARFRNDISWRYRQEYYLNQPQAIFESKYRLFYFNGINLKKTFIYAPRQNELNQLTGLPWLITITLEIRDAIAPRVKALVGLIGNSAVYVLTQVIGKGIGLIGRGIIQGVGNSFQEAKYGRNSQRGK